jgi:aerobic-type carbon monoxide dehydrogenase small subunit (CoxS/CutS family)
VRFILDGQPVSVDPPVGATLLDVLRGELGVTSVKDGCAPQGQCGCCTVLVDGAPRVACVTPARRVEGRTVTTLEGLDTAGQWSEAFLSCGASQCGFCTPGIIVRLERLRREGRLGDPDAVRRSLAAHLCRCTGWQTIVEAAGRIAAGEPVGTDRDLVAASERATLEGGAPQVVSAAVARGAGGFSDDRAPAQALIATTDGEGGWKVADTLAGSRVGKVQGRRTTVEAIPPLEVPAGTWDRVLRTGWVEPAYLELDASWCSPGGEPSSPLANGGAFGSKLDSPVPAAARMLADRYDRVVLARWSREDSVRFGPKRPPIAAGIRADGTGIMRVVACPGVDEAIAQVAPGLVVEHVEVPGPAVSSRIRGAGWVEAAVLRCAVSDVDEVTAPNGSWAAAVVAAGRIEVRVRCGRVLDEVVLRSYCIGAAHMAAGWVTSEGLTVDGEGEVHDLTIRSFGILRADALPEVTVEICEDDTEARNGSDAAFAAVAAAVWRSQGYPEMWPTGIGLVR